MLYRSSQSSPEFLRVPDTLLLKWRLAWPTDHDFKTVAQSPFGLGEAVIVLGNEALFSPFVRNTVVDRIKRQKGIAGKIHLGDQSLQEVETQNGKMDVGWSPGVVVITPGVGSGTNGGELIFTLFIGQATPRPGKVGIEGGGVLVIDMDVTPGGIGLPQFNQSMRHSAAAIIHHPSGYQNPFPNRFARFDSIARQVMIQRLDGISAVHRSRQFRKR